MNTAKTTSGLPSLNESSFKLLLGTITSIALIYIIIIGLGNSLTAMMVAIALVYLFMPFIQLAQRYHIPKSIAIILCLSLALLAIVGLLIWWVPLLIQEGYLFTTNLPNYIKIVFDLIHKTALTYNIDIPLDQNHIIQQITDYLKRLQVSTIKNTLSTATSITSNAIYYLVGLILGLMNLLLIPILFVFLANQHTELSAEIKSWCPKHYRAYLRSTIQKINTILSAYLRGQITVIFFLMICYSVGLSVIGLPFARVVGIVAGLLSFIPYLGMLIGISTSLILAIATSGGWLLISEIIILFLIVNSIENIYITPKLVGNRLGLSTFTSFIAIIIGGNLFGFIGMLLAIPIIAVLLELLMDVKKYFQRMQVM